MAIEENISDRSATVSDGAARKSQVFEPGMALLKFNEIVGVIGTYEICTCFLIGITGMVCAWQIMAYEFEAGHINYTCIVANFTPCDPKCPGVIFPETQNDSSIIQEWNLVCGEAIKAGITQAILLSGQMFGSLVFGHFADHYGRRPCLLATCVIMLVSGLVAGITRWFWLFCLSKFFIGLSCGGQSICCLVFLVEYVQVEKHELMIVMFVFPYALGYTTVPIVAYFVPKWRYLQLTVTALGLIYLSYFWLLPESPRWLLLMGYVDRCIEVLQSSSWNKGISHAQLRKIVRGAHRDLIATDIAKDGTLVDLFRTKNLRRKTCVVGFTWMTLHFKFCGTMSYLKYLSNNDYLNFGVGSFLMIVGNVLAYPVMRCVTRRISIMLTVFLCAICLITMPLIPNDTEHFIAGILGITVIGISSIAFVIMQLYSTELFPTVLRNSGIGLTMCIGRLGCILSPFILHYSLISFSIPPLVYATAMVITGFIVLLLPETKGEKLPDTIEEGENFGKGKRKTEKQPAPSN